MTKEKIKECLNGFVSAEKEEDKLVALAQLNEGLDELYTSLDTVQETNHNLSMQMSKMILESGNQKVEEEPSDTKYTDFSGILEYIERFERNGK